MSKVTYIPLPAPQAPKRNLNFTSEPEARMVANTFLGDPAILGDIKVVAMTPEAVNTQVDGRGWHQIQFIRTMNVTNSQGRKQDVLVPFGLNAGIILDDEVNNPLLPWVFLAESTGTDTWTGDVERSDGH